MNQQIILFLHQTKYTFYGLLCGYLQKLIDMEFIKFEPDSTVPKEIAILYGGNYNIVQSILIGGIGSPEVIYQYGIPFFDEHLASSKHRPTRKTTFSLMQKGLIIRLNNISELKGCLLHFDEIGNIMLKNYADIQIINRHKMQEDGIKVQASLTIILKNSVELFFEVPWTNVKRLAQFFNKKQILTNFEIVDH